MKTYQITADVGIKELANQENGLVGFFITLEILADNMGQAQVKAEMLLTDITDDYNLQSIQECEA